MWKGLLKISCPGTRVQCRSYITLFNKIKGTEVYKCLRSYDSTSFRLQSWEKSDPIKQSMTAERQFWHCPPSQLQVLSRYYDKNNGLITVVRECERRAEVVGFFTGLSSYIQANTLGVNNCDQCSLFTYISVQKHYVWMCLPSKQRKYFSFACSL